MQTTMGVTSDTIAICLVTLYSMMIYVNSLNGQFVMDDAVAIVRNDDLRSNLTDWKSLFYNDYWGTNISSEESHKSYRPFTVMTFRMNYAYGELDPFGYHFGNIILHGICTFLMLIYLKQNQSILILPQAPNIPVSAKAYLWAGILFASHPIHTEAVASVVGRAEPLSCIFALLSLIVYTPRQNRSFTGNTILVCIFAFTSSLCKESGAMVIPICCAFDILDYICCHFTNQNGAELNTQATKTCWRNISTFTVAFAGILYFRVYMTSTNFSPTFSDVDNYIHYIENDLNRVLTYGFLHAKYALTLAMPVHLSCDWSYEAFPAIQSVYDARNLVTICTYSFVFLILFTGLGVCGSFAKGNNASIVYPIIIGLLFFFPASNVLFPVATVLAERVLYLPSIGYCILLPNLISLTLRFLQAEQILDDTRRAWIIGNIRSSSIKRSLLVSLTIWFTYKTYIRNDEWATPMKLYQSATKVVPTSCKAWVCLASAYKDIGDRENARRSVSKALEIKPNFAGAFYILAVMEEELGNVDSAIRNYELTIKHSLYTEFKPDMLRVSLNNVGLMYFKRKKNLKQGLHAFQEGLKLAPNNYALNANIGEVYSSLGRYDQAILHYRAALKKRPHGSPDMLNNLAIAIYQDSIRQGGEEGGNKVLNEVMALYRQALQQKKFHYNSNLNIAKIFYRDKDYVNAARHLNRALKDEKQGEIDHAEVYDLLGRAYMRMKKYKKATKALELGISWLQKGVEGKSRDHDKMLRRLEGNLDGLKSILRDRSR